MNRSPDLITSYRLFDSYPTQLVHQGSYASALQASKARLDKAESDLFTDDAAKVNVPFLDLEPAGQVSNAEVITNDDALRVWLGDPPTTGTNGNLATRRDPQCRLIFFWAGNSRKPLRLTRRMMARILTYHQVMPAYLDFITVFGSQHRPRDLRFSGFRAQTLCSNPPQMPPSAELGRSGQQFQLCYNLKAPFRGTSAKWSVRQSAIHHQFDVVEGRSLWLITKGDLEIKSRIEELTGAQGRPEDRDFATVSACFKSSLAVHLLLCHWSTEEWRWYIQSLEDVIDEKTQTAVHASREQNGPRTRYRPDDLLSLQADEDDINDAIMILQANTDVMTSLRKYYDALRTNEDFPVRNECCEHIISFVAQLEDLIYDLRMQIARATVLVRLTANRKTIILQHLESQATETMEHLTKSMHKMGALAQTEAIAMRIITVVTLLYLPATFVSTFFSTDIVQYQNQNNGSSINTGKNSYTSFSNIALERWLEVTLPLTVITLVFAWIFFKKSLSAARKETELTTGLPLYYKSVTMASGL